MKSVANNKIKIAKMDIMNVINEESKNYRKFAHDFAKSLKRAMSSDEIDYSRFLYTSQTMFRID